MIRKLEIAAVHTELTEELNKYATKKIGNLDKYISRKNRDSVHAEVKLKGSKGQGKKRFTCEVVMHLPHENFSIQESTMNITEAIDIVENKLKIKLKKYSEKNKDLARSRSVRKSLGRLIPRRR